MKNTEINILTNGKLDDIIRDFITDFLRFCAFYCCEITQDEQKVKNKPYIEIDVNKIGLKDSFSIENQRNVLASLLTKIEKYQTDYSIESMKQLMDIYLNYDLFREGKKIEWDNYRNSRITFQTTDISRQRITQAHKKLESIAIANEGKKEKELFENATILCFCKLKLHCDSAVINEKIEKLKLLFKGSLQSDITMLTIGDLYFQNKDFKIALDYYTGFLKTNPNDNLLNATIYYKIGKTYNKYPGCFEDTFLAYETSNSFKESVNAYYKLAYEYFEISNSSSRRKDSLKKRSRRSGIKRNFDEKYNLELSKQHAKKGIQILEEKFKKQNLNPQEVIVYKSLLILYGMCCLHLKDYDSILELENTSENLEGRYIEKNAFFETFFEGKADVYRNILKAFLKLDPNHGKMHMYFAVAYRETRPNDTEKYKKYQRLYSMHRPKK